MGCTVMSNINFDNPWLLLVAVPLIVLFTVPFVIAVRKDNRNWHNITSQVMHIVLAIIIGFAAAGTNFTTVLTKTEVYIVADVSYSANKNLDTIDNIIKSQIELPKNSQVGLITFGKNYELLSELTEQAKLESVSKSIEEGTIDDSETNIAPALYYAGSLFGEEAIKRVVLITDGKQTDEADTSAMRRAVDTLEAQGVKVDAYFIDDNMSADAPEIQISKAEYTRSTFLNHEEQVIVTIQSSVATDAMIYLFKDGEVLEDSTRAPELEVGQNRVEMDLDTTESGWHNYEIRIRAVPETNDTSDFNNSYTFTQNVANNKNVLIITGDWNDTQLLVDQYAGSAAVDIYENANAISVGDRYSYFNRIHAEYENVNYYTFAEVNENSNLYKAGGAKAVPITIDELCLYDEIVLSDVDVRTIANPELFMRNLEVVVSNLGKSLITLGNTYIGDATELNDNLDKLSTMLPVNYKSSSEDKKYYVIAIDVSATMNGARLDGAKSVAKKLISTLQDDDMLSVLGIYGNVNYFREPTPFTNNAETIQSLYNLINKIEIQQGTNFSNAFNQIYEKLSGVYQNYSNKQIMFITDGVSSTSDYNNTTQLVTNLFKDFGAITSVFDVGRSVDTPAAEPNLPAGAPNRSNAAYQFLDSLCNICTDENGERYSDYNYCNMVSAEQIPETTFGAMFEQIFETKQDNKATRIIVKRRADDVMENMPQTDANMPNVTGYYVGRAKGSAVDVLNLNHAVLSNGAIDERALYAYWNYGEGRVATFTCSPTGNWLTNWNQTAATDSEKSLTQTFLDNMMEVNVPKSKADYPYAFTALQTGSSTSVTITPPRSTDSTSILRLSVSIKVWHIESDDLLNTDEIEPIIDADMSLSKDHFAYTFASSEMGKYKIEVTYKNGLTDQEYLSVAVFDVAYANEYNSFTGYEASPLYRAINGRGQVIVPEEVDGVLQYGKLVLENEEYEIGTYTNDYTIPLLVVAVVLFIVDIIIRKLKWEDIVSFFGGFKKTQTTGGKKQ